MSAPVPSSLHGATIYPGHKVLAMFPFFNETEKLDALAQRISAGLADHFVAVNDGSTDDGPEKLRRYGLTVFDQPRSGLGACITRCVEFARENGYDILVVMAGNGKDDPREIPRLLKPIIAGDADYVQGSRFLSGGSSPNLPRFRLIAIKFLSLLFTLYMRKRCTDLTNGFRAYRLSLLDDPRMDIWQDWLRTYEYEYYVHFYAYRLGYRVAEVPVSKTYPSDLRQSYTKIKPFSGWWLMLRPLVFLALGLKK
ncbi:MAG: glycosyltransferase family 2 protein [Rhodospirillaceae bacterium]|nr:glycosyltransferase family 2 protein [Rhodospirillaceae bacterium]